MYKKLMHVFRNMVPDETEMTRKNVGTQRLKLIT